jgi:hypothetical protein
MSISYWKSGDTVVIRHVWRGAVRVAEPARVLEDGPDRLVLFAPVGTVTQRCSIDFDKGIMGPVERHVWHTTNMVRILEPDIGSAATAMYWANTGQFACWYVDLQEPFRRTRDGIVTWDQSLDIVASADLSWRWKDEDEFARLPDHGWITAEQGRAIRREGEKVIARIEARAAPFNEDWPSWRPDPTWPTPVLPEDWAAVPTP